MALRKCVRSGDKPIVNMKSLSLSTKTNDKSQPLDARKTSTEDDVDIDLREVYFLIMHFLSAGPFERTYGQFWNELLKNQLLPRRYHAWYSRSGMHSGDEDDNGMSLPLSYNQLVERYPHIGTNHLVKLLKQLIVGAEAPPQSMIGRNGLNASAVPTLLGTGSFSLLSSDQSKMCNEVGRPPGHMRWPHMSADQVRGLSLREIGGGFSRHHRAPSTRAACSAIAKPSTMVQKMQNIKRVRGHRNAVYCAIFDRSGRYVVTGSDDRLVKIWSMETAFCLASCRGHEGDITDLAVNSLNTLVASSSNDCIIRVWRFPDGLPISVLRGHTGAVTAIAFCPRAGAMYQLLSSSDDGTCRIWDARASHLNPRVYVPKPSDPAAGKNNGPSSSTVPQSHQIFCCAFNASGTVFVTGSSDTLARVWNACKSNADDSEQPNHEMDVLSGHENDVNYVQFSGCAAVSRYSAADASRDENIPKFKNTWFNFDNIVTCSRDGSAIIWIPRSRRSHGKAGRWTRAYHLKVPPPPLPPQPPRGGPRQRILPTPRGVNMIIWSLDNRFVLAAIMDCRICVWNAVDGSLVHSLTGHTESTYVLDVHPFNPRIAMSAGYDGKTIVWDIWEGTPIRVYEIGRFKLVDGKFSPDGTSIILSDDVGQLYILNTGQGEYQQDAKYDQFFLGDYRPLIQDTNGNVLDQETQLPPYRRNMQDLLCDSGMIPYPEPYQSLYQKRRLGALGYEWRPSSVRFAIGTEFNMDQDYQMLPLADLDLWIDPLPEFVDAMDWEPEIEIQSDDNDSEYNVPEEYSSGGEQGHLSSPSYADLGCSSEDSEVEDTLEDDGVRRSKRKKQKEVEIMTSSGRRVKRKNLDGCNDLSLRISAGRKSRNGRKGSRKKSSSSKSQRPRRAAARNALNLFSRITGTSTDGEEEYDSEGDSSESQSSLQDSIVASDESDVSLQNEQIDLSKGKEILLDPSEDLDYGHQGLESRFRSGGKKRLVLKLPNRNTSKFAEGSTSKSENLAVKIGSSSRAQEVYEVKENGTSSHRHRDVDKMEFNDVSKPMRALGLLGGYEEGKIKWGGAKARTSKRSRLGEPLPLSADGGSSSFPLGHLKLEAANNHSVVGNGGRTFASDSRTQNGGLTINETNDMNGSHEEAGISRHLEGAEKENADSTEDHESNIQFHEPGDRPVPYISNGTCNNFTLREDTIQVPTKLRIKSKTLSLARDDPINTENNSSPHDCGHDVDDMPSEIPNAGQNLGLEDLIFDENKRHNMDNGGHEPKESEAPAHMNDRSSLHESQQLHSGSRMFTAVYRRSKTLRDRTNFVAESGSMEASTSNVGNHTGEGTDAAIDGIRRTRSIRLRSSTRDSGAAISNFKLREHHDGLENTSSAEKASETRDSEISNDEWGSGAKISVRSRSTRNRRSSNRFRDISPTPERKKLSQSAKSSWLMLSTHEEGSRYIPQKGDEVVYLRQGHQEYISHSQSKDVGPWQRIQGNIRAVEFCRVENLEYSTLSGSGESCCKMTLQFVDPTSDVANRLFRLTLPEMTGFPDFLVEKTRYDTAIERKWTCRDKCRVWWTNEGDEGGSWWEGRILTVKPKSLEFPDSPWERYVVKYKSDPTDTHFHSPWELHDEKTHWEQPRIDDEIRAKLLQAFAKLEHTAMKQDYYGIQILKQVSEKSDFINRFPVPLSLEVVQSRLQNNYYRRLEALKHDIHVLLSNAESYYGRKTYVLTKMKRLSDWFWRTFSSL